MVRLRHSAFGLCAAALAALVVPAGAQGSPTRVNADRGAPAEIPTEQLRRFLPMPLPRGDLLRTDGRGAARVPVVETETVMPETDPAPAAPGAYLPLESSGTTVLPKSRTAEGRSKGTSGYPFTTTRVFPDLAVQTGAYRMTGKLFFRDPRTNGSYVCSASIIGRRLVLTAGHCVWNGAGRYWFTDFRFVPAYNATLTTQPFGQWLWSRVATTTSWTNGGGVVPNAADFGLIEIRDMAVGGVTRQIGTYLGWYGYVTGRLVANHVTALGYPANIDAGGRMIANAGETRANGATSGLVGSSMTGGSSGGPWFEDFGLQGSGQLLAGSVMNRIVGVTSYGPTNGPSPGFFQGSSILNAEFLTMRTTGCAWTTGNC